jgi:hypothetical protein
MLAMSGYIGENSLKVEAKATANTVVNSSATLADWANRASPTSPRLFCRGDADELRAIRRLRARSPHAMFLRKVGHTFPIRHLAEFIGPVAGRLGGLGFWLGRLEDKPAHQQEGVEDDVHDVAR